jgi:hypothetical protein
MSASRQILRASEQSGVIMHRILAPCLFVRVLSPGSKEMEPAIQEMIHMLLKT